MEVIHGLPAQVNARPTILTIGVFDGVHRGHQHLIGRVVRRAHALECQSAVLTFDPHPDLVVRPESGRLYLTTLEERAAQIAALGVDLLLVLPFTRETMAWGASEFMARVCGAIALRELWAGPDMAVGHRREGTMERLAEIGRGAGYSVHPVEPLTIGGVQVRSTRVRLALDQGQMDEVAHLLGRPFELRAAVAEGDKRGRTIGFPTANLAVGEQHALPANGVYVCRAEVRGERHAAVTNVGVRPTFAGTARRVEAHLLDYSGDIYGEQLRLQFLHRLRGELKFDGVAALVRQIGADVEAARAYLGREP